MCNALNINFPTCPKPIILDIILLTRLEIVRTISFTVSTIKIFCGKPNLLEHYGEEWFSSLRRNVSRVFNIFKRVKGDLTRNGAFLLQIYRKSQHNFVNSMIGTQCRRRRAIERVTRPFDSKQNEAETWLFRRWC